MTEEKTVNVMDFDILKNSVCPLKETSRLSHDGCAQYMTESDIDVINFDSVKDKYIAALSKQHMPVPEVPKSSDALYIANNDDMYFIEFKSGKVKAHDIWLKIFDSLTIFSDIIKVGASYTRKHVSYIVVYDETKNPLQTSQSRVDIAKYFVERKAKEKFIQFNLERFEVLYFKSVFTVTKSEFEQLIQSLRKPVTL